MRRPVSSVGILCGALLLGLAATAEAQATAPAPPLPTHIIKPGQHVWVAEASGGEHSGRVDQITTDSLTLRVGGGTRTISLGSIESVWRRDTVWDGLAGGFAAGSAVTLLAWLLTDDADSSQAGSFSIDLGPGFGGALLISAAAGAVTGAVGLAIDAVHHGRRLVYERTAPRDGVRLSPVLSRRGAGLRLTVRW